MATDRSSSISRLSSRSNSAVPVPVLSPSPAGEEYNALEEGVDDQEAQANEFEDAKEF